MMFSKGSRSVVQLLLVLATLSARAFAAEPGLGPRSILIGQSASFSGPSGDLGREFRQGAHYAFNEVNARGGVHGRQIITVYRDDGYEPGRTRVNTQKFLEQDKVFALFGYVGTAPVISALPLLERYRIPLIAPVTGAQVIRSPLNRFVFNLRASYHQEIVKLVDYLNRYGREAIAIVYQDDAFGRDGLQGLYKALAPVGRKPVAMETVQRNSTDTREAARRVALSKPEAVLLASSYATNASFIKNYRELDSTAQIFNLSFVGSNALARALPQHLRHGIGVMQVVPFPWDARLPIVRDYQMAMKHINASSNLGFSSLEGYMAAQFFIQALEQAGPNPTREGLMRALNDLHNKDLGGFPLETQMASRNGASFVELTFLNGQNGSFIH
jgi:branched-chain amino acid transport system substrate-binding protein